MALRCGLTTLCDRLQVKRDQVVLKNTVGVMRDTTANSEELKRIERTCNDVVQYAHICNKSSLNTFFSYPTLQIIYNGCVPLR